MNADDVPAVIYELIQSVRARHPERPALIGVAGAQGSGKTTACQKLAAENKSFANFSIDDVYFSRAAREASARSMCELQVQHPPHWDTSSRADREAAAASTFPLLATRGPPGTHNLGLANGVIARLFHSLPTRLPRFDKLADRPYPEKDWPLFTGTADAVLVDGWCLGAEPTERSAPLNPVEEEDLLGWWRGDVNAALSSYATFFQAFDAIVYLRPPSWDVVRRWRGQQEVTLRGRTLTAAEDAWIDRFIMHYERITRSMMDGRHSAAIVVQLDEERRVIGVEPRANPPTSRP